MFLGAMSAKKWSESAKYGHDNGNSTYLPSALVQSQFTQSVAQAWTISVYGNCTLERGYLNMNFY